MSFFSCPTRRKLQYTLVCIGSTRVVSWLSSTAVAAAAGRRVSFRSSPRRCERSLPVSGCSPGVCTTPLFLPLGLADRRLNYIQTTPGEISHNQTFKRQHSQTFKNDSSWESAEHETTRWVDTRCKTPSPHYCVCFVQLIKLADHWLVSPYCISRPPLGQTRPERPALRHAKARWIRFECS